MGLVASYAAGAPASAHADADPASDYLITQPVFFSFEQRGSLEQQGQFVQLLNDAKKEGYTIRVALIASPGDLGGVTVLWRKPRPYARFLGQELVHWYTGPLLIVMPDGYGFYHRGHDTATEQRMLDALPKPDNQIMSSAVVAVRVLAARAGVHVSLRDVRSSGSNQTRQRLQIIAIVLGILVLAALAKATQLLRARGRSRA